METCGGWSGELSLHDFLEVEKTKRGSVKPKACRDRVNQTADAEAPARHGARAKPSGLARAIEHGRAKRRRAGRLGMSVFAAEADARQIPNPSRPPPPSRSTATASAQAGQSNNTKETTKKNTEIHGKRKRKVIPVFTRG